MDGQDMLPKQARYTYRVTQSSFPSENILNFLSQSAKEGAAADTADPSYFTGFPSKVKRILFCKALFLQSPLQKQTRKCTLPGDNSTNNLPNRKPWHRKAQKPLRK